MVDAIMSDMDVMRWLPYSDAVSTFEGQQEVALGYINDFITDRENFASRRVMEKIGMRHEKDVGLYGSVAKGNGCGSFETN
jgi:hypothetical protein